MSSSIDQRRFSDHRNAQRTARTLQRQALTVEVRDSEAAELAARTAKLRALRLAKEAADERETGAGEPAKKSKSVSAKG